MTAPEERNASIQLEEAMTILNESANGVTTFNDKYKEACRLAVRLMALIKQNKITINWSRDD